MKYSKLFNENKAYFVCHIFFLWFFCSQYVNSEDVTVTKTKHPVNDFSHHTLIKPHVYEAKQKREITTTKKDGHHYHHDHLTISLPVHDKELLLDLTLNTQLIPKGFFRKVQENGGHKVIHPTSEEIDLCHYTGKVRNKPNSWVALSTCDGLSGVIYDGQEMLYVEKKNSIGGLEDEHVLYKHSDLVEHNKTCDWELDKSHDHNKILRYKRASERKESMRGPYNANKESKYLELLLVVDNLKYKHLDEDTRKVEQYCKNMVNIVNGLYAPLNIFVALVGVIIWTDHDEIVLSPNGDISLNNFLRYRREKLVKQHPNDHAHLLTKFMLENGVIGKSLKDPICTYEYSGGISVDHSSVTGLMASIVAHQIGHNFGMEHDTDECKCPDDKCIMAPSISSVAPTHWSSCSLQSLLLAFSRGMDYCLRNKPTALVGGPLCGNGFVEPGEECDCGLLEHCDNSCCDAITCTLHRNASCATGECCDLTTCKPKDAGILCRSADNECDLPEHCTGHSEYCPTDVYKMDTESCNNGQAFCYHGMCKTRTDQCKLIWGQTGIAGMDQCYNLNMKGSRHGNCGYNKFDQTFSKCQKEDVFCGMLHCIHLNNMTEFGLESVSILSNSFINIKGVIIKCQTVLIDLGLDQVDPGLVPDGAKCGEDKMCVKQKCVSLATLNVTSCVDNCNNNGWCNNLGHCHCKNGYAPPYCKDPGFGGSEDRIGTLLLSPKKKKGISTK